MKCPKCKISKSIPIVYGRPTKELTEKAGRNEVRLGGCILIKNAPNRFCLNCSHSWIDKSETNTS